MVAARCKVAATGARSGEAVEYQRGNLRHIFYKFVHQRPYGISSERSSTRTAGSCVVAATSGTNYYVPAGAGPRPARLRRTLPERTATVRADDCVRICGMTARARAAAERA